MNSHTSEVRAAIAAAATLHDNNRRHSMKTAPKEHAAILIPKALTAYGEQVAALINLGREVEQCFTQLERIESELREQGCTPPRPDLIPSMRAAWSQWRGEGFWDR